MSPQIVIVTACRGKNTFFSQESVLEWDSVFSVCFTYIKKGQHETEFKLFLGQKHLAIVLKCQIDKQTACVIEGNLCVATVCTFHFVVFGLR